MRSHSYVLRIMARLAYLQFKAREGTFDATTTGLHRWLLDISERGGFTGFVPDHPEQLRETLRSLEALGAIAGSTRGQDDDDSQETYWSYASANPFDEKTVSEMGGSGEPPSQTDVDPASGDDDGSGNGLAQILAHPVLFSVEENALDDLIANALNALPEKPA